MGDADAREGEGAPATPDAGATRPSPRGSPRETGLPSIEGYTVVREIHRGGQGIVFEAVQQSTRRTVAIKVLLDGSWASASALRRFEREVDLLAHLRHPNIVAVLDSGTADGRRFFVMDYIDGVRLDEHVRRAGLTLEETLELFAVACRAVNFAHQRGIIHRDLKPSNLLVDADGTLRVLDFGLAKLADAPTETLASAMGEVMGTLPYMSPEQAFGSAGDVDVRSDVFSLGVVLYELLTGAFPHPVSGAVPEVLRHLAETPPSDPRRAWSPSGVVRRRRGRPDRCPIDDDVATILLRALAKERERRYQTAGDLARDIERYLAGEPVDARRDSAWYVLRKTLRRHRVPVAAAVGFVGMLIAASIVLAVMYRGQVVLRERGDAERAAREQALKRAEGLYLSAESSRVLETNPGTGLLLAIEGARRFPGKVADEALHAALHAMSRPGHEQRTFLGHESAVTDGDISPDGRLVVTASADGTCRLWEADTGRAVRVLGGHDGGATHAAFSPDARRVLTAARAGTLRLWDVETGLVERELEGLRGPLAAARFDAAGRRVLGCGRAGSVGRDAPSGGAVMTWDLEAGGAPRVIEGAWSSAELSPDGSLVATVAADGWAHAWEVDTGRRIASFRAEAGPNADAAFSADSRKLLTYGDGGVARSWDVRTGAPLQDYGGHGARILVARFTPDGRRVLTSAAGPDFNVRLFDADSGARLFESGFVLELGAVSSVDCGADGSRMVTASVIDTIAHLRDGRTLKGLWPLLGHDAGVLFAKFSRDGRRVITGSADATARLWDGGAEGSDTDVLSGHAHRVNSAFFDAAGRRIVTGSLDGTAKVWDATSRQVLATCAGHDGMVTFAAFSPDGRLVATGSTDHSARIWDADTGAEVLRLPHAHWVRCVAFSPDGRTLVTGCDDKVARTWDVATGRLLVELRGMSLYVQGVAFSPDGRRIATAGDPSARLWDAATGREERTFAGADEPTMFATFSRDGRRLLVGDRDKRAWLWDVETGARTVTLAGHEAGIWWGEISPDGTRVLTGANDHTARLWDAATGAELATLRGHGSVLTTVTFSPDGRLMLTASADRTARLWPVEPLGTALAARPRDLTQRERERYLPEAVTQPAARASR